MHVAYHAQAIATMAHALQTRRDGVTPYITHPERVAKSLGNRSLETQAVAWLHDVVEDTAITLAELNLLGFPAVVVNGVAAITRRDGEGYTDYLARVKADPIATVVKIADIQDNLAQQPTVNTAEKYRIALQILQD